MLITSHWLLILCAGFIMGLDKGGIKPVGVLSMYLITTIVTPAEMLGIFAPLLLLGELYPAFHYRKSRNSTAVGSFLPWVLLGLAAGGMIGRHIDAAGFNSAIAFFILLMAVLLTFSEFGHLDFPRNADGIMTIGLGVLAGLSSILGNAAGAVTNLYFLHKTDNKKTFLGSSSFLYLFINSTKIIIYLLFWSVFSRISLLISLFMVPAIFAGVLAATLIIKFIPEKVYRIIVIISVYYVGIAFLIAAL
ncbi:MAG: sulfite exporter TauE/SafE family protein [Treponema sp.]|jgi:uncharacterized membrane protein YfcA|nr:sulfite exporter TauE/SafE family protein [Treponema sp.]